MSTSQGALLARPLHEEPAIHSRRWFLLGVMCLSLVLVVMSVSGLVTASPSMQEELNASAGQIQWIIDAYAVVFAGTLLTAGALGDRFGRKRALLAGLVVFGAGALVAGIGTSATQVIVGRGVMGVGAALVMPATLSIITAIFAPEERSRAIAIWAGFAGAGGAIGPIVSGALLERYWWGAAVLINLPVVVATLLAIAAYAPESRDDTKTRLDPVGALLSLVGLGALIFAIIEGGEDGWTAAPVVVAAVVAIVALVSFIRWELRSPHPMLPLSLFRDRRFSIGSGVITVAFFVMFGFFVLATQYLQFARGYSPLEAGLATLPLAVAFVAISPRSAALAERFGAGRVMAFGFVVVAAGFALLAQLDTDTSYLVIGASFFILGSGMSLTAAPATTEIMSAVPLSKLGVGSAVNDTTREVGGALGIAILGSIANSAYRAQIDLSGLGLGASSRAHAEESVGGAIGVAAGAPGSDAIRDRASDAFNHAFTVASTVSVVIALVTAVGLLFWSRPRRADGFDLAIVDMTADGRLATDNVPVGVGNAPE